MSRNRESANTVDKDRIRGEIVAQIEAFLRAGGKIHVLDGDNRDRPAAPGSWCCTTDDIPGMSQ